MKYMNPYLMFEGNAREAMMFYADCFGGAHRDYDL